MTRKKKSNLELLGHIRSSTGKVILIDFGCLDFWCHDKPPSVPEWIIPDPKIRKRINSAVDLRIVGNDAHKAGKILDLNWHPEYIYDIPRSDIKRVQNLFKEVIKKHKLNASLKIMNKRITHKERTTLALEHGNGLGEIKFNGMWAIVIDGIPTDKDLPIYGIRMDIENWLDRWKWVILELRPNMNAVKTQQIGYVLVDEARLIFSDIEALKDFELHKSFDGKADVVFWGRDEELLAKKFNVKKLEDETFGWRNLEEDIALEKARKIHEIRESREYKFAFDYRPHTHDYYLLEQIRSSPTESGTIALGDTIGCGFLTSWGDGAFPVVAEFNESNELVRIKIDLGNERSIETMEKLINK